MFRGLLFPAFFLVGHTLCAQLCLIITRTDGASAFGVIARCTDGQLLGSADALGQLCLTDDCDTLVFGAKGLVQKRVPWSKALREGRVELDPVPKELPSVAITPWPAPLDRRALASFSAADSSALLRYDRSSLRSTLIGMPGVQMDERGHGGSTRLSIRGSLLRAPYGVRGVKVYWGPFALTLADGSTPLELLDPELVGALDVIRSVGGPAYGSAPSGLLLADAPQRSSPGMSASLNSSVGSYGFFKLVVSATTRTAQGSSLSAGLLRLGIDGYRQQEYARRDQAYLVQQWRSGSTVTRAYLTAQKAAWGLPGSLDHATALADPRAARPYSVAINARVEKSQFFAGLGNETVVWKQLAIRSAIQVQSIDKLNPYGTSAAFSGYKDEHIRAGGMRLSAGSSRRWSSVDLSWELGMEALVDRDRLTENAFINTAVGAVRTDDDTWVRNVNAFLSTRTRIADRTTFFADIGMERNTFRLDDALLNTTTTSARNPVLYPLFGIDRALGSNVHVHARYAESTSRPTIWEVLGSTGSWNAALGPERVHETEVGAVMGKEGSGAELAGYLRRTDGLILPHTTAEGAEEFTNAGDAEQNGIELSTHLQCRLPARHRLLLQLNGAWQHHRLKLPEHHGMLDVPGVPRWSGTVLVDLVTRWGPVISVGARALSAISSSTVNEDRIAGYAVLHLRLEQPIKLRYCTMTAFFLMDNLLNEQYTSFVQLNDAAGRYYNPAPGRNFLAGLAIALARSTGEKEQ